MANEIIRATAKAKGVRHWMIADALNIHEAQLCCKLRHELPESETQKILSIIDELAKEGTNAD